eukprot:761306-Hanusia_phi.AAC.1
MNQAVTGLRGKAQFIISPTRWVSADGILSAAGSPPRGARGRAAAAGGSCCPPPPPSGFSAAGAAAGPGPA